ncbi:MAG TPA: PAS domain S-box protein, partial [bacterium]|nr:PAS domain S-box protein [bacterium]
LTTRGSLSGFLSLGGKLTGEETTREELGLLSLVCDYLTAIQENLQLTQEINLQAGYQEAILGSIPTGIVAVDMRGRVTIMNRSAERITGVRAEEVQGQSVETLGSQIADFLRRALRGDEVSRIELTYVPTKAVLGISTRTLQHGEEFQGAVAAFQDLTEVKKMDRERAEVERNRYWNTVAARLSHELKNPLVAIKTFAQMLPLKYEDSEFRSGFAQIVQQEIAKLNRIIEGINRLAEPLNLTVAPVHLLELLNSVGQGIAECPAGKLEVKCAEPFDDLMLADALRLREAFGYILQFCWRDNRGEKPVLCSVKADNQTVTVEYREEGSTLALPSGEEIFLPFVSTLESNLSIGLVLAKKIVEAHEGRMELVTEGNSRKFVITLSLKRDEKNLSGG